MLLRSLLVCGGHRTHMLGQRAVCRAAVIQGSDFEIFTLPPAKTSVIDASSTPSTHDSELFFSESSPASKSAPADDVLNVVHAAVYSEGASAVGHDTAIAPFVEDSGSADSIVNHGVSARGKSQTISSPPRRSWARAKTRHTK